MEPCSGERLAKGTFPHEEAAAGRAGAQGLGHLSSQAAALRREGFAPEGIWQLLEAFLVKTGQRDVRPAGIQWVEAKDVAEYPECTAQTTRRRRSLSEPSVRGEPQPPSCLRVTGGDAREEARLASRLPQAGPGSLFPRLFQAWDTPLVGGGGVGSGSDHHMRIF